MTIFKRVKGAVTYRFLKRRVKEPGYLIKRFVEMRGLSKKCGQEAVKHPPLSDPNLHWAKWEEIYRDRSDWYLQRWNEEIISHYVDRYEKP